MNVSLSIPENIESQRLLPLPIINFVLGNERAEKRVNATPALNITALFRSAICL